MSDFYGVMRDLMIIPHELSMRCSLYYEDIYQKAVEKVIQDTVAQITKEQEEPGSGFFFNQAVAAYEEAQEYAEIAEAYSKVVETEKRLRRDVLDKIHMDKTIAEYKGKADAKSEISFVFRARANMMSLNGK